MIHLTSFRLPILGWNYLFPRSAWFPSEHSLNNSFRGRYFAGNVQHMKNEHHHLHLSRVCRVLIWAFDEGNRLGSQRDMLGRWKEKVLRIVLTMEEKGLFYFNFQYPIKGRVFWSQQKRNVPHDWKGNWVCQKAMPETGSQQMQVTGRCWCRTWWIKKLLRLSYCLTSKLMQVFHYSVFLSSCRLLFHDFFGHEHTALWSISRASQLRLCKCSCMVASPQRAEPHCAYLESLDIQLWSLLAERVMAPHSFPAGLLWPVLRNLPWFSEL